MVKILISPEFIQAELCLVIFFFFLHKGKGAKYMEEKAYFRNFKNMSEGQVQILPNLLFCFLDNGNWGPEVLARGPDWPSAIKDN